MIFTSHFQDLSINSKRMFRKCLPIKINTKRHWRTRIEEMFTLCVVFILIPLVYYSEIFVILPQVTTKGSGEYYIHVFNSVYLMVNIVGNLFYGILTDTSVRRSRQAAAPWWVSCAVCGPQPPRAGHCALCGVCIVRRDHHCVFWARCVGYYNRRFFVGFIFHMFLAMTYCSIYNIKFLSRFLKWHRGLILKFACPIITFLTDPSAETIYVFSIVLNSLLSLFSGSLFLYHLTNIIYGRSVRDTLKNINASSGTSWRTNVTEVLGSRWYLTWILPCVRSPLPGDYVENCPEKDV